MAASVVITGPHWETVQGKSYGYLDFAWTAHTDSAVIKGNTGNLSGPIFGYIDRMVLKPGASVSAGNLSLVENGLDEVLATKTAFATSGNGVAVDVLKTVAAQQLYITVSGAGSGKTGTCRVYIQR